MPRAAFFGVTVCLAMANASAGEMVPVPAGSFLREDGSSVSVSSFSIASHELTKDEYDRVRGWAVSHGYDMAPGIGEGARYPVSNIAWYDAVKFCNAASELAGRTPAYYTDASLSTVYRSGKTDIAADAVKWDANGYRLPAEAEWEYACRAGTTSRFYWGDTTIASAENEYAWHTFWEAVGDDVSPHPVGLKEPNAFGLYDMSGNIVEWCWNWWQDPYHPRNLDNPRGPGAGLWRVMRGGSVALDSIVETAYRSFVSPSYVMFDIGMRVASSDPACAAVGEIAAGLDPNKAPSSVEASPDKADPERVAKKLLPLLIPETPGLEEALKCFNAGQYEEALAAYRDFFFEEQRGIPLQDMYRKDGFGERKDVAKYMALEGRLEWFRTPGRPDNFVHTGLILHESQALLKEWEVTGDLAPLDQWFFIMDSFARHARQDYDSFGNAERAIKNQYYVPQSWDFGMGFTSFTFQVRELQKIIHLLPPDGAEHVPPVELASFLTFLATDSVSMQIKDARDCVPNQRFYVAKMLLNLGDKLREFRHARAWYAEGRRRFEKGVLRGTMMQDGGDLEQSLNYNGGLTQEITELGVMFPGPEHDWIRALQKEGVKRMRFFMGMQQPFGRKPSTGSAYTFFPPPIYADPDALAVLRKGEYQRVQEELTRFPDPDIARVYDHLFGPGAMEPPAFTSIAFPYSGYYVMRNGWDSMSHFLWLMGARPGQGHACENINAIDVIAHGRHLLVTGGAHSYGNPEWIPEDQRGIIDQIDRYRDKSFSRNTVIVDGHSQRRLIFGENLVSKTYENPIQARWHSSPAIDFAEAGYHDGYGNTPDVNIPVSHKRQVIFVREAGLWIVTDRMEADKPHTYSACWNFPPKDFDTRHGKAAGFGEDEVRFDGEHNVIQTCQSDSPNLFMHQFCTSPIAYTKYFGDLNPARGWLAPGISGRRYPKVDIHSSWDTGEGTSLLVTVLSPSPSEESPVVDSEDHSDSSSVGFRLRLTTGATIAYLAATEPRALTIDSFHASAQALLVYQSGDGVTGVVLDGTRIRLGDREEEPPAPSAVFTVQDGDLHFDPITIPTTFRWREGHGPEYH